MKRRHLGVAFTAAGACLYGTAMVLHYYFGLHPLIAALVLAGVCVGWLVTEYRLYDRPRLQWLQRRDRGRDGLCPACGYDLRATPRRCPECGAATDLTQSDECPDTSD